MKTGMFQVKGLNGNTDADKVLEALHHVWGVRRAEVNETTGNASFSFDENAASIHDFEQAIFDAGFQVKQVPADYNERGNRGDANEGM